MSAVTAVDLLVESSFDYKGLDELVQQLGAAVVEGTSDPYRVRCFGGAERYLRFAIENQGYGKVIAAVPCGGAIDV